LNQSQLLCNSLDFAKATKGLGFLIDFGLEGSIHIF
jgi:hypothetical protein